jgi:hypothetical protein
MICKINLMVVPL